MQIKHYFKSTSHDLTGLFEETSKFSQFCSKLMRQSLIDTERYDKDKYVGDGMEFFVELFLNLHPCDNRVGVYNYSPNLGKDTGIDGRGVNIIGEKSIVQIKFRSDVKTLLSSNKDHLSNLVSAGMLENVHYDMENPKNFRHFIFTNANGLHHYTDEETFGKKVKCFGYNQFKALIDNNMIFWANALRISRQLKEDSET